MLPKAFLSRLKIQLGDEYDDYLRSLDRPRAVALRFNPLKGERPDLPFAGAPVPWEPEGVYYDPDSRPGLHVYHEAGVYYLQEASAMAPAALLDPQPGETVLDLCAAPGGGREAVDLKAVSLRERFDHFEKGLPVRCMLHAHSKPLLFCRRESIAQNKMCVNRFF